jgi:drug/metabolite transporter (DMT)-like permease
MAMSSTVVGRGRANADAYLVLSVGVVILSWSPLLIRWAGAPGVATAFFRSSIAVVVLVLPFWWKRRSAGRMVRGAFWLALLAGVSYGIDVGLWSTGITLTGVANPTLLANTAPIWVGLGAMMLFHERLGTGFWAGLALAMAGAALILGLDRWQSVIAGTGSLYGLLAGIFYGGFFLAGQKARESLDTISFFWIVLASSACMLGISMAALRQPLIGYGLSTYRIFLALGVVQVAGWLAVTYALGRLPASTVAPIMLVQPVITAGLAHFLLGERLGPWQSLGGVAVLAGVMLVHRQRAQE